MSMEDDDMSDQEVVSFINFIYSSLFLILNEIIHMGS